MEDFENLDNWDKFVVLNSCYLTAMDCCMEEEAEDYWDRLEAIISEMPEYQQTEAYQYQQDLMNKTYAEEDAEIAKEKEKNKREIKNDDK
jgi:TPP-dependent pyruvate/acetoin dehydrogenase alpha subunit